MAAAGRFRATALVAVGLTFAVATSAAAHNGTGAAFKGPAGRYTVYAYDGYQLPNGDLEYRLVLLNTATGEPIDSVVPVVTARPTGGAGAAQTAQVTVMANVVLYDLPNSYPHDWTVSVALSGPLGRGHAQFLMHGQATYVAPAVHETSGAGTSRWLLPVVALGAAAAAATAVLIARRRRHRGPV